MTPAEARVLRARMAAAHRPVARERRRVLANANQLRTRVAADRTVPAANALLASDSVLTDLQRVVVELRVMFPDASLTDLARLAGVSKDTYSGQLRRVLAKRRGAVSIP